MSQGAFQKQLTHQTGPTAHEAARAAPASRPSPPVGMSGYRDGEHSRKGRGHRGPQSLSPCPSPGRPHGGGMTCVLLWPDV